MQLDGLQAELDEFIYFSEKKQALSFTAVFKHDMIQIQTTILTYTDLYQVLQSAVGYFFYE